MAKSKVEKPEEGSEGVTSITLRATNGANDIPNGYTRTFSLEEHGEDFREQAEAWKKKYEAVEVK